MLKLKQNLLFGIEKHDRPTTSAVIKIVTNKDVPGTNFVGIPII